MFFHRMSTLFLKKINNFFIFPYYLLNFFKRTVYGYIDNEWIISESGFDYSLCQYGTILKGGGEYSCKKCQENGLCLGGYVGNYPKKVMSQPPTNII